MVSITLQLAPQISPRNHKVDNLRGYDISILAHAQLNCFAPPRFGFRPAGWCIYMPCSVTGQEAHDGCPIFTRVEECIWMGCFNFFGGNCMGCS